MTRKRMAAKRHKKAQGRNPLFVFFAVGVMWCGVEFLFAGPGDGIRIKDLTIKPYVDLSATHDSNVYLRETEPERVKDVFWESVIGAEVKYALGWITLEGVGYGFSRSYSSEGERDHGAGDIEANLGIGHREGLKLNAYAGYKRLEDYSRKTYSVNLLDEEDQHLLLFQDRTLRYRRDLLDVIVGLEKLFSNVIEADVVAGRSTAAFDDTDLFDFVETKEEAQLYLNLTDKTSALLTGQYGEHESEGFEKDPYFYVFRTGLKSRTTEKTAFVGSVGFQSYHTGRVGERPSETQEILSYDLGVDWKLTHKISIQAGGRNMIQPSEYDRENTRKVAVMTVGATYKPKEAWFFSVIGSYNNSKYRNAIDPYARTEGDEDLYYYGTELEGRLIQRELTTLVGEVIVDYTPPDKFYRMYVTGSLETTDSNVRGEDFDQLRLSAGVSVYY